jgi:uracil-DNA glycosylase
MTRRIETDADNRRRTRVVGLDERIRACRRCHRAGFLDESVSIPIARDPHLDAPLPRILLIGQAPGLRANNENLPFAGAAGDKLRVWFALGGIAPDDFWRKIHCSAITRCYPGRLAGARGDRLPSPAEQALCRPWLDAQFRVLRPEVVLLVGLLAIRTFVGRVGSLIDTVGTATTRDGVRYLPLPHPSGVSRWLNEAENVAAVGRAMALLRGWVEELGL